MSTQVADHVRSLSQARTEVIEMSALITVLALLVQVVSPLLHKQQSSAKLAINTALETALVLILYVVAVLMWRDSWTPQRGMSDSAAFGPIVGHINALFFAEYGWLGFLICVVPVVAILSGLLSLFPPLPHRRRESDLMPTDPPVISS